MQKTYHAVDQDQPILIELCELKQHFFLIRCCLSLLFCLLNVLLEHSLYFVKWVSVRPYPVLSWSKHVLEYSAVSLYFLKSVKH